jgi:hypothetical protein
MLTYPAPLRAPCGSAKALSFRGPATPPPDECDTGCRDEESTVGPREGRRGSPRHHRGRETARQGRCGASRQVTRTPKVDSSVARNRLCSFRLPVVRSLRKSKARLSGTAPRTLRECKGSVIPRPGHAAARRMRHRLQGRGIYRRPARGRTRQPAPSPRRRNRQTGPVWGVATGHEQTESRFLGRAPAPEETERLGVCAPSE